MPVRIVCRATESGSESTPEASISQTEAGKTLPNERPNPQGLKVLFWDAVLRGKMAKADVCHMCCWQGSRISVQGTPSWYAPAADAESGAARGGILGRGCSSEPRENCR